MSGSKAEANTGPNSVLPNFITNITKLKFSVLGGGLMLSLEKQIRQLTASFEVNASNHINNYAKVADFITFLEQQIKQQDDQSSAQSNQITLTAMINEIKKNSFYIVHTLKKEISILGGEINELIAKPSYSMSNERQKILQILIAVGKTAIRDKKRRSLPQNQLVIASNAFITKALTIITTNNSLYFYNEKCTLSSSVSRNSHDELTDELTKIPQDALTVKLLQELFETYEQLDEDSDQKSTFISGNLHGNPRYNETDDDIALERKIISLGYADTPEKVLDMLKQILFPINTKFISNSMFTTRLGKKLNELKKDQNYIAIKKLLIAIKGYCEKIAPAAITTVAVFFDAEKIDTANHIQLTPRSQNVAKDEQSTPTSADEEFVCAILKTCAIAIQNNILDANEEYPKRFFDIYMEILDFCIFSTKRSLNRDIEASVKHKEQIALNNIYTPYQLLISLLHKKKNYLRNHANLENLQRAAEIELEVRSIEGCLTESFISLYDLSLALLKNPETNNATKITIFDALTFLATLDKYNQTIPQIFMEIIQLLDNSAIIADVTENTLLKDIVCLYRPNPNNPLQYVPIICGNNVEKFYSKLKIFSMKFSYYEKLLQRNAAAKFKKEIDACLKDLNEFTNSQCQPVVEKTTDQRTDEDYALLFLAAIFGNIIAIKALRDDIKNRSALITFHDQIRPTDRYTMQIMSHIFLRHCMKETQANLYGCNQATELENMITDELRQLHNSTTALVAKHTSSYISNYGPLFYDITLFFILEEILPPIDPTRVKGILFNTTDYYLILELIKSAKPSPLKDFILAFISKELKIDINQYDPNYELRVRVDALVTNTYLTTAEENLAAALFFYEDTAAVENNREKAIYFLQQAVKQKCPYAMYLLAYILGHKGKQLTLSNCAEYYSTVRLIEREKINQLKAKEGYNRTLSDNYTNATLIDFESLAINLNPSELIIAACMLGYMKAFIHLFIHFVGVEAEPYAASKLKAGIPENELIAAKIQLMVEYLEEQLQIYPDFLITLFNHLEYAKSARFKMPTELIMQFLDEGIAVAKQFKDVRAKSVPVSVPVPASASSAPPAETKSPSDDIVTLSSSYKKIITRALLVDTESPLDLNTEPPKPKSKSLPASPYKTYRQIDGPQERNKIELLPLFNLTTTKEPNGSLRDNDSDDESPMSSLLLPG